MDKINNVVWCSPFISKIKSGVNPSDIIFFISSSYSPTTQSITIFPYLSINYYLLNLMSPFYLEIVVSLVFSLEPHPINIYFIFNKLILQINIVRDKFAKHKKLTYI